RPAVCARSTKNGPKYGVARSTVPSSGLRRYTNALDDVGTGNVPRLARSAREMVSVVACVDALSRAGLPVCTDWFCRRKVSTLDTVCACDGGGIVRNASTTAESTTRLDV